MNKTLMFIIGMIVFSGIVYATIDLPNNTVELTREMQEVQQYDGTFDVHFGSEIDDNWTYYNIMTTPEIALTQFGHALCLEQSPALEYEMDKDCTGFYKSVKEKESAWAEIGIEGWCEETNGYGYVTQKIKNPTTCWRVKMPVNTTFRMFIGKSGIGETNAEIQFNDI